MVVIPLQKEDVQINFQWGKKKKKAPYNFVVIKWQGHYKQNRASTM